jgi:glycosyltransferase involved in cell wall biosynthesis
MRIVLVTHFLPPERNAGTENYTFGLARALAGNGHSVDVVCATGWTSGQRYWNGVTCDLIDGIRTHRLSLHWMKARDPNRVLYESDVVERWFEELINSVRPEVVHVTSAATLGLGVIRAAHRQPVAQILTLMDFWFMCPRTVLTRDDGQLCRGQTTAWECQKCLLGSSGLFQRLHAWLPDRYEEVFWAGIVSKTPVLARLNGARGMALNMVERKQVMRDVLGLPDVILSHSRFVRDMFEASGCSVRVRHLPNGHDLKWLKGFPGKTQSDALRVVFMGQLAHPKGVDTLIDGFKCAELRNARLDIWGDLTKNVGYVSRLRDCIGSVGAISLRGPFNRNSIGRVLSETDVVVVPSRWYENAPLVIQEAFATKTPVIATNLGGMAECVQHEVNGLLFERNDARDLGRQLRRVSEEPGLLDTLRSGIPEVKTIQDETRELEAVYCEAIEKVQSPFRGNRVDARVSHVLTQLERTSS